MLIDIMYIFICYTYYLCTKSFIYTNIWILEYTLHILHMLRVLCAASVRHPSARMLDPPGGGDAREEAEPAKVLSAQT